MAVLCLCLLTTAACSSGDSGGSSGSPDSSAPGQTGFTRTGAELPEARTEVAGATWNGRIVVAGGLLADGKVSRRVDVYEPRANIWLDGPALPVGLHHLGLAVLADRLYVVGGYTNLPSGEWQAQAAVHSLGANEQEWRSETPLSRPRGAHGTAAVSGRLVVAGGVTGGLTGTSESWAPGEPSWRPGPNLAEAREHLAMAAIGGRAYAIAGRLGGFDSNLRSVESWDGREPSWRGEPQLNDTRGGTAAAEVGGKQVCVAGGEATEGTIASIECLVPGQPRWTKLASMKVPRHGLAVAGIGPQLRVIGGGPQPGLFVSTAHETFETS